MKPGYFRMLLGLLTLAALSANAESGHRYFDKDDGHEISQAEYNRQVRDYNDFVNSPGAWVDSSGTAHRTITTYSYSTRSSGSRSTYSTRSNHGTSYSTNNNYGTSYNTTNNYGPSYNTINNYDDGHTTINNYGRGSTTVNDYGSGSRTTVNRSRR